MEFKTSLSSLIDRTVYDSSDVTSLRTPLFTIRPLLLLGFISTKEATDHKMETLRSDRAISATACVLFVLFSLSAALPERRLRYVEAEDGYHNRKPTSFTNDLRRYCGVGLWRYEEIDGESISGKTDDGNFVTAHSHVEIADAAKREMEPRGRTNDVNYPAPMKMGSHGRLVFEPVLPDITHKYDCDEKGDDYVYRNDKQWKCWKLKRSTESDEQAAAELSTELAAAEAAEKEELGHSTAASKKSETTVVSCWDGYISQYKCNEILKCIYIEKMEGNCWELQYD